MVVVARVQVIALVMVVGAAAPARADELDRSDVLSRITTLNREALDEIDQEAFPAARKHLLEAVGLAKRHTPGATMLLARTYFHLGALAIIARNDRKEAIAWFREAWSLDPDIRPSGQLRARADVMEAFADAEWTSCRPQCRAPRVADPPDPELPASIVGLDCRHDDSVAAQTPLVVRCAAHESVEVTSLYLHYQTGPTTRFKDVMMRITERGWWKAAVPATEVLGTSVRLYVDGRNAGGKRLRAELGDARRPTTVRVRPAEVCPCAPPPRAPIGIGP